MEDHQLEHRDHRDQLGTGPHEATDKLSDLYTLLSTIEHLWHLGRLANTCSPTTSGTLEELFRP